MPSNKPEARQRVTSEPQRPVSRDTATFTPYFWEAYNEIVNPRRFNHYLLTKWLPELGAVGLAIVLVLRDRCYHNPEKGILRDTCEMTMAELSQSVGCSRAFLFKQFAENEALQLFVRRIKQRQMVDGIPRQAENRYQVSMDDPIHPDDMERYDLLRAEKEAGRQPLPATVWKEAKGGKKPESTTKTLAVPESTAETLLPSTTWTPTESTAWTPNDRLPSGGLITKESTTPQTATDPPINPPRGKDADTVISNSGDNDNRYSGLGGQSGITDAPTTRAEVVWESVKSVLESNLPTHRYRLHFGGEKAITLKDLDDTTATLCGPLVLVDSARGKFSGQLSAAFAAVLGRAVAVEFVGG